MRRARQVLAWLFFLLLVVGYAACVLSAVFCDKTSQRGIILIDSKALSH